MDALTGPDWPTPAEALQIPGVAFRLGKVSGVAVGSRSL